MAIVPIPSTRVSDQLIRARLLAQSQIDQAEIFRLQRAISTGRRIESPSDDAPAALRAVSLQRLLERKAQVQTNLATNQSYLAATDTALGSVSTQLASLRGLALSVVGSTSTDAERSAAALEVNRAIQQLIDVGNHRFRGRSLFAGGDTTGEAYTQSGGTVRYNGNEVHLQSYSDIDLLFDSNVHGNEVFGGLSNDVAGIADLNPLVTANTRLRDLRGGAGISRGSISVSDGTSSRTVDLSRAETVGDVVRLLQANAPTGRTLIVSVTNQGLQVELDAAGGGQLSIREVGGGTTAGELGIRRDIGADPGPIVGSDLNPKLTGTTLLRDILGTRATASLRSSGPNNNLLMTSDGRGPDFNDVAVTFVDGGPTVAGFETAVFDDSDPLNKTLTITIAAGITTANQVIAAVNAQSPFTATLDPREIGNNGTGTVLDSVADPTAVATTSGGTGVEFDQASGLRVVNNGQTHEINFSLATTVEDLLNVINGAGADLLAEINADGTGVNIRSRSSGSDFSIGENGGLTATQLGLRTLHVGTPLATLNNGRGVPTVDGTDFTIVRNDGVELAIDLDGAVTIQDVLDRINNHVDNPAGVGHLTAQLVETGNGLQLVDDDQIAPNELTVRRTNFSEAAWALGLIPRGVDETTATSAAVPATATLTLPGPNNDIQLTAEIPGTLLNDYTFSFVDTGLGPGSENVSVALSTKTIVIGIDPATTTAQDVIDLISGDVSLGNLFTASLVDSDGAPNTGAGLITDLAATVTTAGGEPERLDGGDVNPLESGGVFNALLRLQAALAANDTTGIERAIGLLDDADLQVNFARADLGSRAQSLDGLQTRLVDEDIELRASLSTEIDVDLAEAISAYTARQAALQASLQMTGQISRLTLLDYL